MTQLLVSVTSQWNKSLIKIFCVKCNSLGKAVSVLTITQPLTKAIGGLDGPKRIFTSGRSKTEHFPTNLEHRPTLWALMFSNNLAISAIRRIHSELSTPGLWFHLVPTRKKATQTKETQNDHELRVTFHQNVGIDTRDVGDSRVRCYHDRPIVSPTWSRAMQSYSIQL